MTALPPIAIQLYTVRDDLAQDLNGTVQRIAEIGYVGVEPFGLTAESAGIQAGLFNDLGLQVPSVHTRLPLGDDKNEVLDTLGALGCARMISGFGPDHFTTADDVRRVCEQFNEASAVAAQNGMTLGYHNHWWEFEDVDGRSGYEIMLEQLDPAVFFQVDTYWAQCGGYDAAEVVRELGARAPLLHIKDGHITPRKPHVAVGAGRMDIPAVIHAGAGVTEWLIVELDECATDMLAAVEASYRYLVDEGLGRGNVA